MSNYRGGIDLLKLVGAKVLSVNVNGKAQNCVVIPVAWNDISVNADSAGQPKSAYLNFNLWETRPAFRTACMQRNADKADYVAPSHEFAAHYSEEFTEKAIGSAEKRLRADADFMAKGLSDEEIKKQARYDVNNKQRLGTVTPMQPKQPTAYTSAAPTASTGDYVAPTADQPIEPEDDLPF